MGKLLVIADYEHDKFKAIEQGINIAEDLNASMHIVQFIYDSERILGEDPKAAKEAIIEKVTALLTEKLAEKIPAEIDYTFEVVWEKRIHHWVNQYAKEHQPELVLKTGHRTETTLYTPTDWHLIRECKAPVYIGAEDKWRKSVNIFAAIDLETKNTEKQKLNHEVLRKATSLASRKGVDVYVCYAPPVSELLRDFGMQFPDEVESNAQTATKAQVAELAEQYNIPMNHFIVHAGAPEKVIPSMAADCKAGVVVIGSLARTGISGQLIGNTAEKILSLLKSDVLVIKS